MPLECSTRVLAVTSESPDPAILGEAALVLRRGGLVAFATETVYGLGAVATDSEAVERIFAAKGRPAVNPLIVHVTGIDQAREYAADWPADAEVLARTFWPGPLTVVLPRSDRIPDVVTAGRPTVGLRSPAGAVAQGLIARCGRPLAAPSANRSNALSPTRAEHVLADLGGRVDLILDSGPTAVGLESTVIDLTGDRPRLLRPGPITVAEIVSTLEGRDVLIPAAGESAARPMSPGQMPVHYAPRTPAFRMDCADDLAALPPRGAIAILALGNQPLPAGITAAACVRLESPERAARMLYGELHRLDALRPDAIFVLMPPDRPEWLAVRDRLMRATRPVREWQ